MSANDEPGDLEWALARSAHPRLRIDLDGTDAGVLDDLATAFTRHKHKVKKRTATGFSARNVDWVSLAAADIRYSRVRVAVGPGPQGTSVALVVEEGHNNRPGRKNCARALAEAVGQWRGQGREVVVHDWEYPAGLTKEDWPPW